MTWDGEVPLRTLHVCHTTDRRGAEVSTIDLVDQLRERRVESVAVWLQPGTADEALPLATLGSHGRTPSSLWKLRTMARQVDFVVAHGASTLIATSVALSGLDTPFVYRMIGDPRFWGNVRFADLRIGRALRSAACVVTLWQGAADSVHELYRIPEDRLAVIVNGRDPSKFRPPTPAERTQARQKFGLPSVGPVIGYLGALRWEKDPMLAIGAATLVPGAHLAMAGDGDLRMEVDAAAAARPGQVSVLGATDDARTFLWTLDVLLLTSKTEGLPGVIIEAGLCGVPVVAPVVGGSADLVDETTGSLVASGSSAPAYAEALEKVLADGPARGAALRTHCLESMTVDAAADRWVSLFMGLAR